MTGLLWPRDTSSRWRLAVWLFLGFSLCVRWPSSLSSCRWPLYQAPEGTHLQVLKPLVPWPPVCLPPMCLLGEAIVCGWLVGPKPRCTLRKELLLRVGGRQPEKQARAWPALAAPPSRMSSHNGIRRRRTHRCQGPMVCVGHQASKDTTHMGQDSPSGPQFNLTSSSRARSPSRVTSGDSGGWDCGV